MTTPKFDSRTAQKVQDGLTFEMYPGSKTLLPSNIETTHKLLYAIATQLYRLTEMLRPLAEAKEVEGPEEGKE